MKYVTLPSPKNLFSLRRLTFASGGQWILAHVAYALPPLTREERAIRAKVLISTRFNTRQQVFLDFMLSQYVKVGVEELDREKLSPLLKLKYNNAIADAVADLGRPEEIGNVFVLSSSGMTPLTGHNYFK